MFPEFLKEFESGLEKYKRDCIKITATPVDSEAATDIRQSKFSGLPYLPINIDYPRDANGIPMLLLAQLNFEGAPHLPGYPSDGLLQFFVTKDWTEIYGDDNNDNQCKVLYHPDLSLNDQTDFSFLAQEILVESPMPCEYALAFEKKTEYGGPGDKDFDFSFNGMEWFEFCGTLNQDQNEAFDEFFDSVGHKLGGYAFFTQDDERDYDDSKTDLLPLLQIDSEEGIMIGDAGLIHFFISQEDLERKDFSRVHFQWDCC